MRAVVAAVAATMLAGAACGGHAAATRSHPATTLRATRSHPATTPPATRSHPATTPPATLSSHRACDLLRADLARNGGAPDIPALRAIADHVTEPRLAADARTAVRDIGHTGVAPLALALLEDDCRRAGVEILAP